MMFLHRFAAKLSIRLFIVVLALVSIIACFLLGMTAITSISSLAKGQADLAKMSAIQEASAAVIAALINIENRQSRILSTESETDIAELSDSSVVISQYEAANATLTALVSDNPEMEALLSELDNQFQGFSLTDQALYENRKDILYYKTNIANSEGEINEKLNTLDTLIGSILGKARFSDKRLQRKAKRAITNVTKYQQERVPDLDFYFDPELIDNLIETSTQLVSGDNSKFIDIITNIESDYLILSALTREIIAVESFDRLISLKKNKIDQRINSINELITTLAKVSENLDTEADTISSLTQNINDYITLAFAGDKSVYSFKLEKVESETNEQALRQSSNRNAIELSNVIQKLSDTVINARNKTEENSQLIVSNAQTSILIKMSTVVFLMILFSAYLVFSINKPLHKVTDALEEIAKGEGDLTKRLDTQVIKELSKIAMAFNLFVDKISATISRVSVASSSLEASSKELKKLSNEAKIDVTNQQEETQNMAGKISDTARAAEHIATLTEETRLSSNDVKQLAVESNQIVENAVMSIEALASTIENSKVSINSLDAKSVEIGTVLDVIRSIAEQTNLLALNAAIEAARAGEQGRGFAVVADEVRSLASRTQQSTVEIEGMIKQLQQGAQDSVKLIQEGNTVVEKTVEQVKHASESLDKIIDAVVSISKSNTAIANAAEEQSTFSQEVNQNIRTIANVGERSVKNSDDIMQSANELETLSIKLKQLMAQFKV